MSIDPIRQRNRTAKRSFFLLVFISYVTYFNTGCSSPVPFSETDRVRDFDSGWRFSRDSAIAVMQNDYNDSQWKVLDLPHDWSIEDLPQGFPGETIGPFSKESPGNTATGNTIGGTGWYRKKFTLSAKDKNKLVSVYFEGAYMETDTWINGNYLGSHKNGYTSFLYDITKYCKPAGDSNLITVRVTNMGRNSRWYSGSGIYRHVRLILTNPLHIEQWGVYISTPQVSAEAATIKLQSTVLNQENKEQNITLRTRLLNADDKEVASTEALQTVAANGKAEMSTDITLLSPRLWSPDSPYLYRAEISILVNGQTKDRVTSFFGIRSLQFSAANGFELNGQKLELRGGCVHHDNGILGAAAIDRAEERRIELLKANGFNAIRCSHNPPSEKFLEACDRLGMLVIDEAFDQWQRPKNPEDYHRFFDDYWEQDISAMVMRDRNHPSIILWSIGNEINERADSSGLAITKQLKGKVSQLDPSRLVTEAICEFWDHPTGRPWLDTRPAFALLDVGGYNYQWWNYEPDHENFPQRIMMGTESVPIHAFENWQLVEKHPYVIGDFVWTAMDYLGESGIGHTACDTGKDEQLRPWPWFNANCGDIDLTGFKKPQSYFRDVVWRRSKLEMAVHTPLAEGCKEKVSYWGWPDEQQSWTWPGQEGKKIGINVYSRYPLVRLELNGKSLGEKRVSDSTKLTAKFEVLYHPGELKAIGIEGGKEVATVVLTSTNAPQGLRLKADRLAITANRNDLCYITVEVVDDKGNLVPNAHIPIEFSISGDGDLAAVGNANPSDMASFKQPRCNSFRGKCLLILRPTGRAGNIKLQASSPGLSTAEIIIATK